MIGNPANKVIKRKKWRKDTWRNRMLTEEERDVLCFRTTVICIRDDISNELPQLNCLPLYVFIAVVSILMGQYFPAKINFPEKYPAACFLSTPFHGSVFFLPGSLRQIHWKTVVHFQILCYTSCSN